MTWVTRVPVSKLGNIARPQDWLVLAVPRPRWSLVPMSVLKIIAGPQEWLLVTPKFALLPQSSTRTGKPWSRHSPLRFLSRVHASAVLLDCLCAKTE